MEDIIAEYGYLAVFIGSFLEGETILVLGGIAAFRGYLDIELVILIAVVGSFLGDQLYFHLGRRYGPWVLGRRPTWRPPADRALGLLHKYDTIFILSFRFLYGIRTVSSFAIGMAGVRPARFLVLNFVAAALWGVVLGLAGYSFGFAIERILDAVKRYEAPIFGAIVIAGAILWLARAVRRRSAVKRYQPVWLDRSTDTD